MTIISVLFLVLELLILAIGIVKGYRRGIGRSAVRLAYLAIIGVACLFLGRFISSKLSATVVSALHGFLTAEIENMILLAPEVEILVGNILGALFVPFLFAVLFGILQLLSLIGFKKISEKIVTAACGDREAPTWSKWAGAGIGLVASLAISAALLSPLFTALYVVDNTPDKTIAIFEDALANTDGLEATPANINTMSVPVSTMSLHVKPSFNVTKFSPWNLWATKLLTSYDIPQHHEKVVHESLISSLPVITEMIGDALYAYNYTVLGGGTTNDALSNAASNVIPYLEKSECVKHACADVLSAMGKTLQEKGECFGIVLPESENPLVKSMVDSLVNSVSRTTADSVEANMISLFGTPNISYDPNVDIHKEHSVEDNHGILSTMTKLDKDDPASSAEGSDMAGSIIDSLGNIAENENMSSMLDEVRDYTAEMIQGSGVDLSDRQYEDFYEDIKGDIVSQVTSPTEGDTELTITQKAKNIEGLLKKRLDKIGLKVDDLQISVVALCIAKEFSGDEYISEDGQLNISTKDLMTFFGISAEDIPFWVE